MLFFAVIAQGKHEQYSIQNVSVHMWKSIRTRLPSIDLPEARPKKCDKETVHYLSMSKITGSPARLPIACPHRLWTSSTSTPRSR
jgi:hypothetical protein